MILDTIRGWFGGGSPPGDTVTCQQALERINEFLDGELSEEAAKRVDEHFRICAACYPHLKLEERFRARLQSALGESEVPDDVRVRILDLLSGEEERGSAGGP
ncbi:MAG: zf-HC2 domain-containing protein [Gemmatimonadota bacterium]|jgi:anti-sigma factor (TIGR02949 family)